MSALGGHLLIRYISIHAPREGGDPCRPAKLCRDRHFNPRPPRGGRLGSGKVYLKEYTFQSTPPARGATTGGGRNHRHAEISIHAPREGGDGKCRDLSDRKVGISIHAPREGGDGLGGPQDHHVAISIHAPREGGDSWPKWW